MTQGLAKAWLTSLFLLTHPMWDVTCRQCAFYNPFQISTHTSHARCDDSLKRIDRFHCISTHTSRVGCDWKLQKCFVPSLNFYSHIPCGMWPDVVNANQQAYNNFYSHIPCGMWHASWSSFSGLARFLLTHPVWDVTISVYQMGEVLGNFYSHIPCGMWLILSFALS